MLGDLAIEERGLARLGYAEFPVEIVQDQIVMVPGGRESLGSKIDLRVITPDEDAIAGRSGGFDPAGERSELVAAIPIGERFMRQRKIFGDRFGRQ